MRFALPRFPAEFEIPDEWWLEAGMQQFVRRSKAYRSRANESVAPDEVEPSFRNRSRPLDWNRFDRIRMVSVLKRAIITGASLVHAEFSDQASGRTYIHR